MTVQQRNDILEAVDILRTLGGNNGFSNLQPRIRKILLKKANRLEEIVKNDIDGVKENDSTFVAEDFDGETVYGGTE